MILGPCKRMMNMGMEHGSNLINIQLKRVVLKCSSATHMRARDEYPTTSPARSRLPASQFSGLSGAGSCINATTACIRMIHKTELRA